MALDYNFLVGLQMKKCYNCTNWDHTDVGSERMCTIKSRLTEQDFLCKCYMPVKAVFEFAEKSELHYSLGAHIGRIVLDYEPVWQMTSIIADVSIRETNYCLYVLAQEIDPTDFTIQLENAKKFIVKTCRILQKVDEYIQSSNFLRK